MNRRTHPLFRLLAVAFAASLPAACALGPETTDPGPPVINEVAAKALAHRNNCLRCHGVTKPKEGPTYAEVAGKYRAMRGAEDRLHEHLVKGESLMADGHREDHKMIRAQSDDQIRNLVRWILAQ